MKKAWVRSLALAWMEDYQSIHRHDFPYPSKDKIHGTMLFFNELDASCQSLEHLGLNYLFGTFGSNWTQQYRQAFDFLVRAGRIPPRDHQAYTDLNRVLIQLKYIEQAEGTWYKPLLTEFHTFMQEIREKYQQHGWNSDEKYQQESILTAIAAASRFLQFTGDTVQRTSDLNSDQFFRFFLSLPGYKFSMARFVYFLNFKRKVFQPICLEHDSGKSASREISRRNKTGGNKIKSEATDYNSSVLSGDEYHNLLKELYQSPPSKARNALICLFAVLYGQRPPSICKIRFDAVTQDKDGNFHIKFASVPIQIDEHTAKVLGMYMSKRLALKNCRKSGNPYLFPGESYGSYLSTETINNDLKEYGVTSNVLFATALTRFYQGGLAQPKVLMDALGIASGTAMKYYANAGVRIVDELLSEKGKNPNA